jgi:hypothetical protein
MALLGLGIIRRLLSAKKSISYSDLARALGVVSSDDWNQGHASQTDYVLRLIDAVTRQRGEVLDFSCVVDKRTGRPGVGIKKVTRLVTTNKAGKRKWKRGYPDGSL